MAHLISADNEDVGEAYRTIRAELGMFNQELLQKEEIVVISKIDTISDPKELKKKVKDLERVSKKEVILLSLFDDASIKNFSNHLNGVLNPKAEKKVVKKVVKKVAKKKR